eukprot:4397191-Lingulodinium_polyedra.AAC.1
MGTPKEWLRMGCARRAVREPLRAADGRLDRTIEHVSKTVRNDAVESTVRGRNASQIARLAHSMRTPKNA